MRLQRPCKAAILAGALLAVGCGGEPAGSDATMPAMGDRDAAPDSTDVPTVPSARPEPPPASASDRAAPAAPATVDDGTLAPPRRDGNRTETISPPPDAADAEAARLLAATVTPDQFMVTAEGQTLSAEVTVHLSGPTDEAPSITLERSESFPDVDLSISDPGRGEQGAAWRSTLTVSHPARVVLPPGYVWEGAVVVEVGNDRRMEVPFTVRIGSTGPVDRKAREFMAGRLGVPVDEIMVTEVEPVTFNDGAKGCDRGEHAVVTAEVAGFIITLAHGSAVHIVHTDEHGLHFVVRENCIEGFWRPR